MPGEKPQAQKSSFPKGIFAVVLVSVLALVAGVLTKSQGNTIFTAVLGLNLVIALGLFLRKEPIRRAATFAALFVVMAGATLTLTYWGHVDNTVKAEKLFVTEAKKLQNQSPTKQLTHEQQQHLDAMQLSLQAKQDGVAKNSTLIYGKYGVTMVMFALIAFYLTRTKVKEAFAPVRIER